MRRSKGLRFCLLVGLLLVAASMVNVGVASAQQEGFIPINASKSNKTIVLKGNRLTIQEIVDIARYGAKVKIAKSHQDYMNRAYNLIIEASRQGIPVYRFNRGAGAARETVIFEGDPYTPANLANLQARRDERGERRTLARPRSLHPVRGGGGDRPGHDGRAGEQHHVRRERPSDRTEDR